MPDPVHLPGGAFSSSGHRSARTEQDASMTESAGVPSASTPRGPRTRRIGGLAIVLLLAACLVGVPAWWFNRAPSLVGGRTAAGFTFAPSPVESAAGAASIAFPDSQGRDEEILTFQSATAHFVTNTAHSKAVVAICRRRPGQSAIGAVPAHSVSRHCSQTRPIARGTTMQWAEGRSHKEYLLLILTPTTSGISRVDRVRYTYARDWRHGHQHGDDVAGGIDVAVRATG